MRGTVGGSRPVEVGGGCFRAERLFFGGFRARGDLQWCESHSFLWFSVRGGGLQTYEP